MRCTAKNSSAIMWLQYWLVFKKHFFSWHHGNRTQAYFKNSMFEAFHLDKQYSLRSKPVLCVDRNVIMCNIKRKWKMWNYVFHFQIHKQTFVYYALYSVFMEELFYLCYIIIEYLRSLLFNMSEYFATKICKISAAIAAVECCWN